jgi:molecular chaperone DnaJ
MNTLEACNLLGIATGASDDDVAKAFRKKAAELHPDVNKEPDAEAKFKQVNEAYQLLKKHGTTYNPANTRGPTYHPTDDFAEELRRQMDSVFFGGFRRTNTKNPFADMNNPFANPFANRENDIELHCKIDFSESILGVKKQLTYEHKTQCPKCKGQKKIKNNAISCNKCDGKGYRKYGDGEKNLPCTTCKGSGITFDLNDCSECAGKGYHFTTRLLTVNIPPGVETGLRLTFVNKGHLNGDASVTISVTPDPDMQRVENNVISTIEISLLEALKGTKRQVRTLKGEKTLKIQPGLRHRDSIQVSGYGVPPLGAHIFNVNVKYPDNVDKLIEWLENSSSTSENAKIEEEIKPQEAEAKQEEPAPSEGEQIGI